ncbi:riboflavin kinase [Mycoplasmopsis maculosa]|uniref:FAD synthase n=1 Tax=Mycoplasmopsis maculosa TaxID=114885 RepID=A0A449B5D0_9BACT|nr:hypothetical protein [Mycoplasmopsis maculosa]VEU75792.1 riboflavin kinase [Mycoplasmopsis maculosa]
MSLNIYNLYNKPKFNNPIYIIGSFESFHLGHNSLFEKAKEINKNLNRDIILVFFKDPENINKNHKNFIFTDFFYRIQSFANLGFLNAIYLEFSKLKELKPDEFLRLLINDDNKQKVSIIVGEDFKFGFQGSGNKDLLIKTYGKENIYILESLRIGNNIKISTSFIKECVELGDIELVNSLNLFKFGFTCDIENDENINIYFDEKIIQARPGLYIVYVEINSITYYAILKIDYKYKHFLTFIDFKFSGNSIKNARIIFLKSLRFFKDLVDLEITEKDLEKAKKEFLLF